MTFDHNRPGLGMPAGIRQLLLKLGVGRLRRSRDQDILVLLGQPSGDSNDLLGGLSQSEDDLRKTAPQPTMVVNLDEAQILERKVAELLGRFLVGYMAMSTVYILAVYYVLNHTDRAHNRRGLLAWTLIVAMALRAIFLFTPPVLSDDIYRYVWDGRVQNEGLNPYAYAPAAPQLEHLRDPIYQSINNKELPTIYPPMMQVVLMASTLLSESVFGMKATFVVIDVALIGILVILLTAAIVSHRRIGRRRTPVSPPDRERVLSDSLGESRAMQKVVSNARKMEATQMPSAWHDPPK